MQRGHATRPCIAAIHRGVILQRPPEDVFSPEQTNLNARQLHAAACWLEVRFFVGTIALNPETGTTTQGETIAEALLNLKEATSLYFVEFS